MNSSLFHILKEKDLTDVKQNSDILFYSYSCILACLGFFLLYENNGHPLVLLYIFVFFLLSIFALFANKKAPNTVFISVFGISSFFLFISRFFLINESGSSPALTYIEASFIITILFRYGWKVGLIYALAFISLAYLRLIYLNHPFFDALQLSAISFGQMLLVGSLVTTYIVLLTVFYNHRVNQLNIEILKDEQLLIRQLTSLDSKQQMINKQLEELEIISNSNSHIFRAPICSLRGLIALRDAMKADSQDKDHLLEMLITEEQKNCLNEIQDSIYQLEQRLN